MTKTRVIRVFSFIMALTLVFAMFSAPSYAISKQQMGAWVASALTALNITWNSTVAPFYQGMDYFADPFQISEYGAFEQVPYTYDRIDDILDQSTISFAGDTITIDGKDYQNIWLSTDAAEKFRVNAFDIKDAFNIASNSNGTYVTGWGHNGSTPLFEADNKIFSQRVFVGPGSSATFDDGIINSQTSSSGGGLYTWSYDSSYLYQGRQGASFWIEQYQTNPLRFQGYWSQSGTDRHSFGIHNSTSVQEPFDFDWVSSEIPADNPLPENYGLNIYIPTNPDQWADNPDVANAITNYNNYVDDHSEFAPGTDVTLDKDSGVLDKLGDILDIIKPLLNLVKPNYNVKDQEPEPVPPEPEPWDDILDALRDLWNKLTDIQTILQNISNYLTAFKNTVESLLANILSQFQNLSQYLHDILEQLSDLIDTLLHHDSDWFSDVVDAIKAPFLRWFGILKSATGIWHYVVQWVQNISAPFGYFFNILANINSTFLSPFYAVAAAAIVIAIYRRFGR